MAAAATVAAAAAKACIFLLIAHIDQIAFACQTTFTTWPHLLCLFIHIIICFRSSFFSTHSLLAQFVFKLQFLLLPFCACACFFFFFCFFSFFLSFTGNSVCHHRVRTCICWWCRSYTARTISTQIEREHCESWINCTVTIWTKIGCFLFACFLSNSYWPLLLNGSTKETRSTETNRSRIKHQLMIVPGIFANKRNQMNLRRDNESLVCVFISERNQYENAQRNT